MFEGIITAIVTPFYDGRVDEESLRTLIGFQVENGIHGIVPCGTTGEAATLTREEYERVLRITVEAVGGRVPVVAGAGANSTAKAVELTRFAQQAGADAALHSAPYYNTPTQEGIYRHFQAIAEVGLPVMVYNVPGRAGVNITPQTMSRLAEIPQVASVKEAGGDIAQMAEINRLCGDRITMLSGDDGLILPAMSVGGRGAVSVIGNLLPAETVAIFEAWETGDVTNARKRQFDLQPIISVMFMETNPIPVKTALAMKALIKSPELRLPLCAMNKTNHEKLAHTMAKAGLITKA